MVRTSMRCVEPGRIAGRACFREPHSLRTFRSGKVKTIQIRAASGNASFAQFRLQQARTSWLQGNGGALGAVDTASCFSGS